MQILAIIKKAAFGLLGLVGKLEIFVTFCFAIPFLSVLGAVISTTLTSPIDKGVFDEKIGVSYAVPVL